MEWHFAFLVPQSLMSACSITHCAGVRTCILCRLRMTMVWASKPWTSWRIPLRRGDMPGCRLALTRVGRGAMVWQAVQAKPIPSKFGSTREKMVCTSLSLSKHQKRWNIFLIWKSAHRTKTKKSHRSIAGVGCIKKTRYDSPTQAASEVFEMFS